MCERGRDRGREGIGVREGGREEKEGGNGCEVGGGIAGEGEGWNEWI